MTPTNMLRPETSKAHQRTLCCLDILQSKMRRKGTGPDGQRLFTIHRMHKHGSLTLIDGFACWSLDGHVGNQIKPLERKSIQTQSLTVLLRHPFPIPVSSRSAVLFQARLPMIRLLSPTIATLARIDNFLIVYPFFLFFVFFLKTSRDRRYPQAGRRLRDRRHRLVRKPKYLVVQGKDISPEINRTPCGV
jgi:hypothetical protein